MKAILIARVSTEEQREAENSLPAQIARLERYCQNKEFEILQICSFDESAYTHQRSEFDRIIDFILEQKEKVIVCCDKVDRISRNIFDTRISKLYELFVSSEVEEKRQLIKLVLSNLKVEDEYVLYNAQKPFDMILKTIDSKGKRTIQDKLLVSFLKIHGHIARQGTKNGRARRSLPSRKAWISEDWRQSLCALRTFRWSGLKEQVNLIPQKSLLFT